MMASNSASLLFHLLILGFLSIYASARPCKSLFIASYSFSIQPVYPNPNPNPNDPSSGLVTIVAEISHQSSSFSSSEIFVDLPEAESRGLEPSRIERQQRPFGFFFHDLNSFHDRTKGILSVVVALLLGVGCGALTAATMYLVLSIFSSAREDYGAKFDADDEDFDITPKKLGYVKLLGADSISEPIKQAV